MLPTIYISKRCIHCRKLLLMLRERPQLKGHYKIVSIDDEPFPQSVKSVPCMIVDDQYITATDLFNYIISSDGGQGQNPQQRNPQQRQQQRQPQQQMQNDPQSCSVDEIDGVCPSGNCLDFAPIEDNMNFSNDNYSYIDAPQQPQMNHSSSSEQGSEKRKALDSDYERLMAERGEMMAKPSFA